ncbi:unnamed protein product [Somion occarium]|uniref:Uncharacterized protein n=1 Tax=Somion occarium TaxID=3059160 RepID=A0ABP1DWS9_9APHY
MYLRPPAIHQIHNEESWPVPVKKLASLLRKPLPSLKVGHVTSKSDISPAAAMILAELAEGVYDNYVSSDVVSNPLYDVLNIVLTVAAGMRQLVKISDITGMSHRTSTLTYSLLATIGRHMSQELCQLSNVPFILPRTKGDAGAYHSPTEGPLQVEGISTLLMACIITPERLVTSSAVSTCEPDNYTDVISAGNSDSNSSEARRALAFSGNEDAEVEENNEEEEVDDDDNSDNNDDSNDEEGEENEEEEQEEDQEEDQEEEQEIENNNVKPLPFPVLNAPFDAHVLPGRGNRFCAALPVISVADSANIEPLLSSVLYQRFVWGIDEPVVGFVISEYGTVVQLYLGWLDLDHNVPSVNIGCSTTSGVGNPALGVFDLTVPSSSCLLAQFILNLKSHCEEIGLAATRNRFRDFCWRSDHQGKDKEEFGSDDSVHAGDAHIRQWLQSIPAEGTHSDSSMRRIGATLASKHVNEVHQMTTDDENLEAPRRLEIEINDTVESGSNMMPSDITENKDDVDDDASHISIDSSQLYVIHQRLLRPDPYDFHVFFWLTERNVALIGRFPQNPKQPEYLEMNRMVAQYEKDVQFHWPAAWPQTMKSHHRSMIDVVSRGLSSLKEKGEEINDLDSSLLPFLLQKMDFMFSCFPETADGSLEQHLKDAYETKQRLSSPWDCLLYHFYIHDSTEVVSTSVLSNVTLNLSLNKVANFLLNGEEEPARNMLAALVEECVLRYLEQLPYLSMDRKKEALAGATVAMRCSSMVTSVLEEGEAFQTHILNRALKDPLTMDCDAVLVTRVEEHVNLLQTQDSKSTTHCQQTGSASSPCSQWIQSPSTQSCNPRMSNSKTVKNRENARDAFWDTLMCCVSAVEYLASLGIEDFPVYGVFASGSVGNLIMTWHSSASKRIYVFERYLKTFDVSDPVDIFWFSVFLLRLRMSQDLNLLTYASSLHVDNAKTWSQYDQTCFLRGTSL